MTAALADTLLLLVRKSDLSEIERMDAREAIEEAFANHIEELSDEVKANRTAPVAKLARQAQPIFALSVEQFNEMVEKAVEAKIQARASGAAPASAAPDLEDRLAKQQAQIDELLAQRSAPVNPQV
jgi:hypothetical protein